MALWNITVTVSRTVQPDYRLAFSKSSLTIGASPRSDVVLDDPRVSLQHATVLISQSSLMFIDSSTNGSFFAGRRVQRKILGDSDWISIPPYLLKFSLRLTDEVYRTGPGSKSLPPEHRPASRRKRSSASPSNEFPARKRTAACRDSAVSSWLVVVVEGPPKLLGTAFALRRKANLVGRARSADVPLDLATVSRRQATIACEAGVSPMIEDHQSLNGTYVNGRPIRQAELRSGDEIAFGPEVRVRFLHVGEMSGWSRRQLSAAEAESAAQDIEVSADRVLICRPCSLTDVDLPVIKIGGAVDSYNYLELSEALKDQIDPGVTRIALDLGDLEFIDHSGLAVLIQTKSHLEQRGGQLYLVNVGQWLKDAFSLTRLDVLFANHILPDLSHLPRKAKQS